MEFKDNNEITIRKADKSSISFILDKENCMKKITTILGNDTKFRRIIGNPTIDLKNNRIFQRIKQGFHLRPITSQISAVSHKLAKQLTNIVSPFVPATYSLRATEKFLDFLKGVSLSGIIVSVHAESLFAHLPVDETIDLICHTGYTTLASVLFLSQMIDFVFGLQTSTKEAPFYDPNGNMYLQIDRVAMRSPLRILFADFYMGLEKNFLRTA
ncbi:uncharacterized protein LOC143024424 [Oratosquilla oratoria]|uniref:uncharacterized protein LOC143024424 n=1 Tax=Oratosquilla oratoria TaxID=337810 RepID=UPI003F775465